eukprot:209666-Pyramimonas_sp.AAC.1
MAEAARLTRNEIQALPIGDYTEDAEDGRRLSMRAIARAVWRPDAHLARRLISSTALGEKHLIVSPAEVVSLIAAEDFERGCRLLHAAWHGRQRAAAAARLGEEARLRPGAEGPGKW